MKMKWLSKFSIEWNENEIFLKKNFIQWIIEWFVLRKINSMKLNPFYFENYAIFYAQLSIILQDKTRLSEKKNLPTEQRKSEEMVFRKFGVRPIIQWIIRMIEWFIKWFHWMEPEIIGFLQFHSMKSTSFNEKIIQWNEIFSDELKMKWFLKFSMQWNENEMISQNFNEMKWKWNIWSKFHRMINENANEKLIRNSTT